MSETLQPIGTKVCTFGTRVPAQIDSNCHLNVDETMMDRSEVDYIEGTQVGLVFEVPFGNVLELGRFLYLRPEFFWSGFDDTLRGAARFDVLLDGVSVVTPKEVYMDTAAIFTAGQLTWLQGQFQAGLTGLQWNAAAEKTGRITLFEGATISEVPDPYTGS